jgi:pimeloyl-ACP methyl ester carboxylesterase
MITSTDADGSNGPRGPGDPLDPRGSRGHWHGPSVAEWAASGRIRDLAGHRVFTIDAPATGGESAEPLLIIHGFPTCSYDYWAVLDRLRRERRVLLVDLLGFGLTSKPDRPYTLALQADIVCAFTADAEVSELSLLTHDLGDSVGGELLARNLEGRWPVEIARRVLTNGSIYIELAHLTDGQQLLLSLPDEKLGPDAPINADGMAASLRATFAPGADVSRAELDTLWSFISHDEGHRLLPRLIRYIEERRSNERRFTGAIESHPSSLSVVWGAEDPIAVPSMVDALRTARPGVPCELLDGVGHYPMLEAPDRFSSAVLAGLDRP